MCDHNEYDFNTGCRILQVQSAKFVNVQQNLFIPECLLHSCFLETIIVQQKNTGSRLKCLFSDVLFALKNEFSDILWWRRGELNPCPKPYPLEHLRVQSVFGVFPSRRAR
jgi:hypothetical protein